MTDYRGFLEEQKNNMGKNPYQVTDGNYKPRETSQTKIPELKIVPRAIGISRAGEEDFKIIERNKKWEWKKQ